MRAIINNFKIVDRSPIFYSIKFEKEWDELHSNVVVIIGLHSLLESVRSPSGQRCLLIKSKRKEKKNCMIWRKKKLYWYGGYMIVVFDHV